MSTAPSAGSAEGGPDAASTSPDPALGAYSSRTLIILNPAAGHDSPARLRRRLGGAFAERGAAFDLVTTRHRGHATELAREAVRLGYRAVTVVGGDGTLAEVVTGLAGTTVPLAIVARGTGNQVANNLHIPLKLDDAVEVAVNGVPTAMDLGRMDGRFFALVAGAGYDAAVMASATRELKERFGFAAYVFAAAKEALAVQPTRFRLEADGRQLEVSAVSVMLANTGELFAGLLPFTLPLMPSPVDSWRDGQLDILIVAPKGLTGFADVLWKAARRQFTGNQRLIHLRAHDVSIDADPPVPVQIDGDPAGITPVRASVASGALRVLLPRG